MAVGPHEPEASRLMLRVAPQRFFHNPKRQRGIALLTFVTGIVFSHWRIHNPKRQRGIAQAVVG